MKSQVLIAFLAGAVVALGAAFIVCVGRGLPEAHAQTAGNNEIVSLMGNSTQGRGDRDVLFVIDSKSMRLCVYRLQGDVLNLISVRNMTYDLKFEEYPGNSKPSVAEVRDKTREEDNGKKKPK
jgi:hypothetical protein